MDYGLYVGHSLEPVFKGTAGECRAHVDELTDEQQQSGWKIVPLPLEPSPLPVDPDLWKRVLVLVSAVGGIMLILVFALWEATR
jgi:hypothetical protein